MGHRLAIRMPRAPADVTQGVGSAPVVRIADPRTSGIGALPPSIGTSATAQNWSQGGPPGQLHPIRPGPVETLASRILSCLLLARSGPRAIIFWFSEGRAASHGPPPDCAVSFGRPEGSKSNRCDLAGPGFASSPARMESNCQRPSSIHMVSWAAQPST